MLRITGARTVVIDHETEVAGDLLLSDVVLNDAGESADILDASGCIVTPGLVNAHHHLLQSGFRTLPGTRGVAMADWLPAMAAAYSAAGIDASLVSATTAIGIAEGLLSGVTTVADHMLNWDHGSSIEATVEVADAIASAAAALGGRLVFVRGSAREEPVRVAESAAAIARAWTLERGVSTDGMLQLAVGPAGVHSDAEATFRGLGEVAA